MFSSRSPLIRRSIAAERDRRRTSEILPFTFDSEPATSDPSFKVRAPLTEETVPDICAPLPSEIAPLTLFSDVALA
jgi:hypothetical protein